MARANVVFSGKLKKRCKGRMWSKWEERVFELDTEGKLRYYKDGNLKGEVQVRGCAVLRSPRTTWGFDVTAKTEKLTLAAHDEAAMRVWLAALTRFKDLKDAEPEVPLPPRPQAPVPDWSHRSTPFCIETDPEATVDDEAPATSSVEETLVAAVERRSVRWSTRLNMPVKEEPQWLMHLRASDHWPLVEVYLSPLWAPATIANWDAEQATVTVVGHADLGVVAVASSELRPLEVPDDPSAASGEVSLATGAPVRALYLGDRKWYEAAVVDAAADFANLVFLDYDETQHTSFAYVGASDATLEDDEEHFAMELPDDTSPSYYASLVAAGVPKEAAMAAADRRGCSAEDVELVLEEEGEEESPKAARLFSPAILADLAESSECFDDAALLELFTKLDRNERGHLTPLDLVVASRGRARHRLAAAAIATFTALDENNNNTGVLDLDTFKINFRRIASYPNDNTDIQALLWYWRFTA